MPPRSTTQEAVRPDERVMVFIDGSNLYHVLTQACGRHDLQFGKFAEKLANGRDLRRTYYYNIRQESERYPQNASDQDRFLAALYDTPFLEVRLGISKQRGEAMVEKGVDVMIAIDLVGKAHQDLYDTAILVSGDGDFFPAIQAVKDLGKHVEVAAFDTNISSEAARAADLHVKLTKTFFTSLWMTRSQLRNTGVAKPEVTDEASSPNGENKKVRTPARNGRRSDGGRTAAGRSESPAAPPAAAQPEPVAPSGREAEPDTDRPGIRRTPVRRRVGGTAVNGDTPYETQSGPQPPTLRRPEKTESGEDAPERNGDSDGPTRRRGGWLRRLGVTNPPDSE